MSLSATYVTFWLKYSLEKREREIRVSKKMLNGVIFTIFIPFSFLAISLYEMHESL